MKSNRHLIDRTGFFQSTLQTRIGINYISGSARYSSMFQSRRFLNVFKNDNAFDTQGAYIIAKIFNLQPLWLLCHSACLTVKLSFHRSKTSKYFFFVHIHTQTRRATINNNRAALHTCLRFLGKSRTCSAAQRYKSSTDTMRTCWNRQRYQLLSSNIVIQICRRHLNPARF